MMPDHPTLGAFIALMLSAIAAKLGGNLVEYMFAGLKIVFGVIKKIASKYLRRS